MAAFFGRLSGALTLPHGWTQAALFEFGDDLVGDLVIEAVVGKGVALRMPGRRPPRAAPAKAGFVGWAHAKNRFKIASGDSEDD